MHDEADIINIGIDGWLLLADAMKLYELTYFCPGDVIELGTYRGTLDLYHCRSGQRQRTGMRNRHR